MRILKKAMSLDEIEKEVINIKSEGSAQVIEDKKIFHLMQSYYYDQRDNKLKFLSSNLTKNVIWLLKRRNMTMLDFGDELKRKSAQYNPMYKSNDLLKEEYYRADNILPMAIDFGFGLNVNPWDLLFHDCEYLFTKNLLSTF
jgi:hypothetical protein